MADGAQLPSGLPPVLALGSQGEVGQRVAPDDRGLRVGIAGVHAPAVTAAREAAMRQVPGSVAVRRSHTPSKESLPPTVTPDQALALGWRRTLCSAATSTGWSASQCTVTLASASSWFVRSPSWPSIGDEAAQLHRVRAQLVALAGERDAAGLASPAQRHYKAAAGRELGPDGVGMSHAPTVKMTRS